MAHRRVRWRRRTSMPAGVTKPKEETAPPGPFLAGSYDPGFGLRRLLAGADPGGQVMSSHHCNPRFGNGSRRRSTRTCDIAPAGGLVAAQPSSSEPPVPAGTDLRPRESPDLRPREWPTGRCERIREVATVTWRPRRDRSMGLTGPDRRTRSPPRFTGSPKRNPSDSVDPEAPHRHLLLQGIAQDLLVEPPTGRKGLFRRPR